MATQVWFITTRAEDSFVNPFTDPTTMSKLVSVSG